MKLSHAALVVPAIILGASVALVAQDPVRVSPNNYKVALDNASVRVLQVSVPAGGKTATHSHPDAIVVTLAGGKIRFTMPDGTSQEQNLANDSAMYTPAGIHSGENLGTTALSAIVVELKGAAPGKAVLPTSRPGLTLNVLAEGPRAMAIRTTAAADFTEPAGTKHEFDQVVIAISPAQIALSIDGKVAKTTWVRGDAQFIGRGVPHESKNTGGRPVDMILVAIR